MLILENTRYVVNERELIFSHWLLYGANGMFQEHKKPPTLMLLVSDKSPRSLRLKFETVLL